jgi:neutral ceramidase
MARDIFRLPPASDELRACQKPKAILFAPGEVKPQPAISQVQPLGVARIGQLVLIAGPAEFTTMSGRRIREAVGAALGESARYLVIAGYANGYAGYVTTNEEYQTQQYEGGHTLFGPWTQAGYQQEFVRLAAALQAGETVDAGPLPRDVRPEVPSTPLSLAPDVPPTGANFGDATTQPQQKYQPGDKVVAAFWTGDPRNDFRTGNNFATIEKRADDGWTAVATDTDWETKCRFAARGDSTRSFEITIEWTIPADAKPGEYRIVHHGRYRLADAEAARQFDATSQPFQVE